MCWDGFLLVKTEWLPHLFEKPTLNDVCMIVNIACVIKAGRFAACILLTKEAPVQNKYN